MPNIVVFNSQNDPLYVNNINNSTNPTTVIDMSASNATLGKLFTITTGNQTVAQATGYLVFEIKNPANSGKTIYISMVMGGGTSASTLDILKNATIGSGTPTTVTPVNTNYSSSNTSVVTGRYLSNNTDPTSGGTLLYATPLSTGSSSSQHQGEIIIPSTTSNQYFYLRLLNTVANATFAINVIWWEV